MPSDGSDNDFLLVLYGMLMRTIQVALASALGGKGRS